MTDNILICDPDIEFSKQISIDIANANLQSIAAFDGDSARTQAKLKEFSAIIIDINTKNISSFEFLGFLKFNSQNSKIFFTYEDEKLLKNIGITKNNARRVGINKLLKKPYQTSQVFDYLNQPKEKTSLDGRPIDNNSIELKLLDKNFTETTILNYISDNISVVDLFLKIKSNKYFKIVHKGDYVSKSKIEKLQKEKNVKHLYFLTSERTIYIQSLNSYLKKYIAFSDPKYRATSEITETIIDKYIEEIYTQGFNPAVLAEGKELCENVYNTMKNETLLAQYIDVMANKHENLSHLFLTSIFSSLITLNTSWATKKTFDYVIQGSLLINIGLLNIPFKTTQKKYSEMTPKEKKQYEQHPSNGYDMLHQSSFPQQVKQIVYQHHEHIDGSGYPNKISGVRIFPLAKIVSFASDFADYVISNKVSPKEALMDILPQRSLVSKYDSGVIKSLVMALNNKESS